MKKNQEEKNQRLKAICTENGISYDDILTLLESVKTKRLIKRNNYHSSKIEDVINKNLNK